MRILLLAALLTVGRPGNAAAAAALPPVSGVAAAAADAPVAPPIPPSPVSPVATFRQLLALAPTERTAALARRPEATREFLRTRLADYEALPADQRENRLRATELYWYLQQLIARTPAERTPLLATASPDLRPVLDDRMTVWDRLPETDRRTLREHEQAIRYFARWHGIPTPPPLPGPNVGPAPTVSLRLQADLTRLQELPAADRDRAVENWRQFFEASGPRTERALQAMSDSERGEMQEVLRKFRSLPPGQRQTCISSFARLANLPNAERADFLRRAERWEALPVEERAAWRRLITMLPPLPPVPGSSPAGPPLPPPPPKRTLLTGSSPNP